MSLNSATNKPFQIAIDGYSSCGKSTLAKQIAKHLNITYIDTGAMYRAFTLYCLNHSILPSEDAQIQAHIPYIHIDLVVDKEHTEVYLNGEKVNDAIRGMKVSNAVSAYSANPFIRKALVKQQQEMGANHSVVLDGRDIGTSVFPNADLKLFMTADEEVRIQRRYRELVPHHPNLSIEEVRSNISKRDFEDTHRKESPLLKAEDAILLDNSNMTEKEQFQWVLSKIEQHL